MLTKIIWIFQILFVSLQCQKDKDNDKGKGKTLKYIFQHTQNKNVKKCLNLTSFNKIIFQKVWLFQIFFVPLHCQIKIKY